MATVGVTGAAGFIAGHLVAALLRRGYNVIGTVRSLAVGEYLWLLPHAKERLKLVEADLMRPGDFDSCFEGCEGVFHTASPFFLTMSSPDDFMKPAVEGTLNVYRGCAKAKSVRRVVTTSSFATVIFGHDHTTDTAPYTEKDFNTTSSPTSASAVDVYRASKVAAERAGTEFVQQEHPSFDLITLHPPFVIGPWLPGYTRHNESSMVLNNTLVSGAAPAPGGFGIVDVRDVALAHVQAYETLAASGRYLISSGTFYWTELHEFLRHIRPCASPELVRAAAAAHPLPSHPDVVPFRPRIDCALAARELAWQPQHTPEDTLGEQFASLKAAGLW